MTIYNEDETKDKYIPNQKSTNINLPLILPLKTMISLFDFFTRKLGVFFAVSQRIFALQVYSKITY